MDDAVAGHAVLHRDAREAVDLDGDEAGPARHIDAETLVLQQRRQIHVEASLGDVLPLRLVVVVAVAARLLLLLVEGVGVEGLVGNDVVL